jgi:hypothetical protein
MTCHAYECTDELFFKPDVKIVSSSKRIGRLFVEKKKDRQIDQHFTTSVYKDYITYKPHGM